MQILVAGAGHGGLVAAAKLAQNGHSVTVFEKQKKENLGHDWDDRFTFSVLEKIVGKKVPDDSWQYRGDCAFVSPSYRTDVVIRYTEENRQKIMNRKTVLAMLLFYAEQTGVRFSFETTVSAPIVENNKVVGLQTSDGDKNGDLVIDAAGVFSPVRSGLPDGFGIEKMPVRGDLFYVWRAYFNKTEKVSPDVPFEVFLCHNRAQGLSWCCTNEDSVDILIGRIDTLKEDELSDCIAGFCSRHPYIGKDILRGGNRAVIPVRRSLALMVAPGYAAVGDSAFMTTPMNGMGIDLSLQAGQLLADTIIAAKNVNTETLWRYNREYHMKYGGITAKNEGLKNALLEMPGEGVDFLFDHAIIQDSDLAGAGAKTSISSLFGKFVRGMNNPKYFFALLKGIIKGASMKKQLENAPEKYDFEAIQTWQRQVKDCVHPVERK